MDTDRDSTPATTARTVSANHGEPAGAALDLAGQRHWNSVWDRHARRRQVDLRSYYDYRLEKVFRELIAPRSRVLEVGCGGSIWLPYFATAWKCEVWGIDYTASGVARARENLEAVNADGHLSQADAFEPNPVPRDWFDVVMSAGLIEHFDDTARVVRQMSGYLRPSGIMITRVPNLHGFVGWLHKMADRQVYDMHVRLEPHDLDTFHHQAGLESVLSAHYLGVFSLGVANFNRLRKRLPRWLDRLLWSGLIAAQQAVCLPFRLVHLPLESRWFSPWIIGAYRRPELGQCSPSPTA